jgi:uroporphyrinogen decarboxylase
MDPYDLKREYGGRLVLHGAVDVQGWLQVASVREIEEEIDRLSAEVGAGGGYIMSPSHQIQPDTPIDHVLAFYEAATRRRC